MVAVFNMDKVELERSSVHRGLDVRMKVAGLEALDLIATLILAATLNVFGFPTFLVLGLPLLLIVVLFFGKRNKPDGYLQHLIRFYLTAGHYSAGQLSKWREQIEFKIYEK